MLKKLLTLSLALSLELCATEAFTLKSMQKYLNEENPYVYRAIGKKYVAQEKLNATDGLFDTKIVAKYDEKEYPSSSGTYYGASLEKPTEFGIDLSAGYRYAYGTQEYNNIKTGKDGEFIVGAKLPIIALLNQIDERRLRVGLSKMDLKNSEYAYKESMRSLYFRLMSDYYLLLNHKALLDISHEMLQKVEKRRSFLESNVEKGNMPQIVLLEASQQVLNAEENLLNATRAYENKLTELLAYLNLSKEQFKALYHLPELPEPLNEEFTFDESIEVAMQKRTDFKIFNTEIEKLLLSNKNNERKKYPKVDLGLYGVQDLNDESGFKLSLNVSFPFAQSEYRAKSAEIQESIKLINSEKQTRIIELKSDLLNIINSLALIKQNLQNAKEQTILLEKLELAERRKYELGSSTLFLLNQREISTMQSKRKIIEYKFEHQLLLESYKRILNLYTSES